MDPDKQRPLGRATKLIALQPAAIAIAAAVVMLAPALSQAAAPRRGVIDAMLQRRLVTLAPTARVKVLVLLRGHAGAGAKQSRTTYERLLRRSSSRSQARLLRVAGAPQRRFWLVNAFTVSASRATIARIARHPAVWRIQLDHMAAKIHARRRTFAIASGNWGLAAMGVPTVWSAYGITGAGVRLASIDTGVDPAHADLAGKVVGWRDFVNGRPAPYDDVGHGTATIHVMVAGGAAPLGAAPGAEVLVAKAFDANGAAKPSDLIAAVEWMADPDGNPATADAPSIINNSWGTDDPNDTWFRPLLKNLLALGILPVFSAGNDGPDPMTIEAPAGYPEALAIGATDQTGAVAGASSRGPVVWQDRDGTGPAAGTVLVKPDITGPGEEINLTDANGTSVWSGSSMATAEISGVAALIKQARPSLSPDAVRAVLVGTATDIAAAGLDSDSGPAPSTPWLRSAASSAHQRPLRPCRSRAAEPGTPDGNRSIT